MALLVGCASSGPGAAVGAATAIPAGALPLSHIHGVGIDPAGATLLLATHEGLFEVGGDGASARIGPVVDLMGFAVAGPGHFFASGHPGPGVDLPQPVGLIESTDGGRTWQPVSRQGQSDFHALTVGESVVLGFDGSLWRSADTEQWEQVVIPQEAACLAASPDGSRVLATTAAGLLQSGDGGRSWSSVPSAPLLQVVDWTADGAGAVGVDPSGVVWSSADAAATWERRGELGAPPQALDVDGSGDAARVVVVTAEALVESRDGGRTFEVVLKR